MWSPMTTSSLINRLLFISLFILSGCLSPSNSSFYHLYPGSSLESVRVSTLSSHFDENIEKIVEESNPKAVTAGFRLWSIKPISRSFIRRERSRNPKTADKSGKELRAKKFLDILRLPKTKTCHFHI